MPNDSPIEVQIAEESAEVPDPEDLRAWADAALAAVKTEVATDGAAGLTIRVVDEAEARTLNRDFRGRDYATNVLSFPFDDVAPEALDEMEAPYLGDLAICAPVVAREAAEQGKAPAAHWAHMVVHGVLHLSGHDHQHDSEAQAMEGLERRILASLGFPDPYQATAPDKRVTDEQAHG
jgi:probable rRNA maturation factor